MIDLRLDHADRAVDDGRRSVDADVQSCLDAVQERGHGFVRFLLQVVIGVEGTPELTQVRLGRINPGGERLLGSHRIPQEVESSPSDSSAAEVPPSDREHGFSKQIVG